MTELSTVPQRQIESETDFLSRPLLATLNLDWEKAIYIALISLAIVTRFWDLGSRVMSHDESLHTQFSYQYYNGEGYNHTPLMHGPFLFHATAATYWLFGDNDYTARIPVAILGIILVVMPYLLRPWLGRIGALLTSFFFLISPYIMYYSRYIRHDIFVITWAMIVVIGMWYYLRERQEKYLWIFTVGTVLMFSTKEVSFIYVAIFGSFLVVRLLPQLWQSAWLQNGWANLRTPILIILIAVLLIGGGFVGQHLVANGAEAAATPEALEGFAADPEADAAVETEPEVTSAAELALRWTQIAGIGVLGAGLFLTVRAMRPHIDNYPEFDLIILFATLVLPLVSPLLTEIAGWNPRDYTINQCILEGQESMSSLQLMVARLGNSTCWSAFLTSGMVRSGIFLILALVVGILVGLWWNRRRWLIAAAIFHTIFFVLYTSVFTNPGGWASGMIGSLGYWLEQQGVQRGSQPHFYYFFVVPFYEFLPLIFALAAVRLWLKQKRLHKVVGYWLTVILISLLAYSLGNWLFNRTAVAIGEPANSFPGLIAGLLVLGVGVLFWFFVRRGQLLEAYGFRRNFQGLVPDDAWCDFVPFVTWWLVLTWVAYSVAGEKMPWLSTHFVIPMALLSGWYFNEKLASTRVRSLLSRPAGLLLGLTVVLIVALALALGPLLLGQVQLGNQQLSNLNTVGRFLGSLVIAGIIFYYWRRLNERVEPEARNAIIVLGFLAVLSLLTIRFTYMANFPNADYAKEFMVYAHGAPATKSTILDQVEELSLRLHGDKSIRVAFGGSGVPWPFTWYLREYPNRNYFGESPGANLTESPIVLVGRSHWDQVDQLLRNSYDYHTYTYLWWPMEEYRKINWNAILGNSSDEVRRGLGNPEVRQALWDIFFYRDYTKYGEVFGGTYSEGQWPLRDDLRLYIRKDVLATLWDHGISAIGAEGLEDPYAEGELQLSPLMVLNESGVAGSGQGELLSPRNLAIGPDGRIYVADSGNHRIQVFDEDGQFLTSWGSFGSDPGLLNEPWSLAVDDEYVYVTDTWNYRIQKFTTDGDFVTSYGQGGVLGEEATGDGLGIFFGPRDITFLDDNRLLITDTGNHRLQVMDQDGEFLSQIGNGGQPGGLLGQFYEPVGLAVAPDGFIYLTDTWNGRVQRFTPELQAVHEWQVDAWIGTSIDNKPYVAVDSAGRVYVTDPEGYRVLIFGATGEYLGRFGRFGPDVNSFGLPNGIAIDAQDNVYVADAANNRILKFAPVFGPPAAAADEEAEDDAAPTEDSSPEEEGDAVEEDQSGEADNTESSTENEP